MKAFILAQTAINFLGAILSKDAVGRLFCAGYGVWGVAVYFIYLYH